MGLTSVVLFGIKTTKKVCSVQQYNNNNNNNNLSVQPSHHYEAGLWRNGSIGPLILNL